MMRLLIKKRYPIRGLMMSHMFVEVDDTIQSGDQVVMYSNDIRIDEFTFKVVLVQILSKSVH